MTPESMVATGQVLLWLAGLIVLVRQTASWRNGVPGLPRWELAWSDFLLRSWIIVAVSLVFQWAATHLALQSFKPKSDEYLIMVVPALPLGVLLACGGFWKQDRAGWFSRSPVLKSGLLTFLVAMPVVALTAFIWSVVLKLLGLPADRQDVVNSFVNMHTPLLKGLLGLYAVVLAPLAEETLFRGVLYRFCRGRMPAWGATVLPAAIWASLHGLPAFAPLLALGILFSLAYERTGNLAVPMLAHALFNLNTLILLLVAPNL